MKQLNANIAQTTVKHVKMKNLVKYVQKINGYIGTNPCVMKLNVMSNSVINVLMMISVTSVKMDIMQMKKLIGNAINVQVIVNGVTTQKLVMSVSLTSI